MLVHPWVSDGVHLMSPDIIYQGSGDVCVCRGVDGQVCLVKLRLCAPICVCACVDVWMCVLCFCGCADMCLCVYIEGNGLEVCFHFLVVKRFNGRLYHLNQK